MKIDLQTIRSSFRQAQKGRASRHAAEDRIAPSRTQYDWLLLRNLSRDLEEILATVRSGSEGQSAGLALDVGSFRCPYRPLLEAQGFEVKTLDLTLEYGADLEGRADCTGLPDASVDLLLCTQVLEHTPEPWLALDEFRRVVKPGGYIVLAVPHVWFYHPHPGDYWRVTPEGLDYLCRRSGFDVEELRVQGGTVAAMAQMLNVVVYGLLGKMGAPLFAVVASVGDLLDRVLSNPLFTLNVACKARRLP